VGAFSLIRPGALADPDATRARLGAAFRRQGFGAPQVLSGPGWEIAAYGGLASGAALHVQPAADRRAAGAGTLFYRGRAGTAALARLAEDAAAGGIDHDALHGSYAVALEGPAGLEVLTDRIGTLPLYVDAAQTVLSTSFLALAEALPRLTPDPVGIYDYLLQEAPHGGRTLFEEIRVVAGDRVLSVGPDGLAARDRPPPVPALPVKAPLDDHAEACLAPLRAQARDYAAAFAGRIDTALSGGFDSRLILALLREQGVMPRLHVYGRAGDADVRIAQAIAAGEGLALEHTDKAQAAVVPPDAFPGVVAANLLAFDGCPNDGLFNNGADLATRRARCAGGELMLNGGGGEIFRNFFYLPDRPLSARQLAWAFYGRFDPEAMGPRFDAGAYVDGLAARIADAVGGDPARLTRQQVELAYPLFRCRYWMGRNNGVNNRLGAAVTPFCTGAAVPAAAAVPLAAKNAGRLEARMIARADPALARYASAYGFPFDRPPPAGYRLKDALTRHRPPWLRRYTYRLKHRRPPALPLYLTPAYVSRVLGDGFDAVRPFLEPARAGDAGMYNRLCSLALLLHHLGGKAGG
jgi:asparagine synthase (glutamine-hydrolysing)